MPTDLSEALMIMLVAVAVIKTGASQAKIAGERAEYDFMISLYASPLGAVLTGAVHFDVPPTPDLSF